MADKGDAAAGWPIAQGDFHTGDVKSPVAVVTMGSHLDEQAICNAGAAIAGFTGYLVMTDTLDRKGKRHSPEAA